MAATNLTGPRRPTFVRAFLPFWTAVSLGALILSADYHRRHAPLTVLQVKVTIDGEAPEEGFAITANGQAHRLVEPISLGSKTIQITAPDTEPAERKRFVWYGPNDLGLVDLKRMHGGLKLTVEPPPDTVEVHGGHANRTNTTGDFMDLPAGAYEAIFRFGGLEDRTRLRVVGNQVTPYRRIAPIGSLELSAEPAEGDFELQSKMTVGGWTGTFPGSLPRLTAGNYHLIARRGDYRREYDLSVRPNETNRMTVKFVYGVVELASEPANAEVWLGGSRLGTTPLKLPSVVPAQYRFELHKEGFDVRAVELTVEGEATAKAAVTLVNTRYRESLEAARRDRQEGRFTAALQNLEAALHEQPDDPVARQLLPATRAAALREQAVVRARAGDFDQALPLLAESRKLVPEQPGLAALEAEIRQAKIKHDTEATAQRIVAHHQEAEAAFRRSLRDEPNTEVFPTEIWHTSKSAVEVRRACEKVGHEDAAWRVNSVVPDTEAAFTCKLGNLIPLIGWGIYARIGVSGLEAGDTEIRIMQFGYMPSTQGAIPDPDAKRMRGRMHDFRQKLSAQLGDDLK